MRVIFLFFLLLWNTIVCAQKEINGEPFDLKCEYLTNPIGIDTFEPRLTWKLNDDRQGALQTAYQVLVGRDSAEIVDNRGGSWDSGKRDRSDRLVVYEGEPLEPLTRYFWKVLVWDKDGKPNASEVAVFETGMMGSGYWEGAWISDGHDIDDPSAGYFRKEFKIEKTIEYARVYIATAGLHELSINGEKIGDHFLDPMYTRFDRRILYVPYDITSSLQTGGNAIGVVLGNGWYNHHSLAVWDFHNAPWRNRPAFCLDLYIQYEDGTKEVIKSERDWKTSSGPITSNSIYTGEHYDARLEHTGWNEYGFEDKNWEGVRYRSAPSSLIVSQQMEPIRLTQSFVPQKMQKFGDSVYVFDMGQNMSGVTKFIAKGKEGTRIELRHGERLDEKGRLDMSNIDVYYRGDKETDPFQTDIVTLSGKGVDTFMPKFNYKGFRYVEVVSSEPLELDEKSLTAYFVHSDVQPTGKVKSSSFLVNKLWEITNNAYLSNLMGYPTDCPQREKNGWTGDGHLAIQTALYNFDGITIYEKWLADHRDEQQPNGVLPDIIPTGGWGYGTANGLDWTSTIAIIPWELYLFYGDSRPLRDNYDNIKRYLTYVEGISSDGLTTFGRGDWVPVSSSSDLELTSSVYFYVDAYILASAAALFGKQSDYEKYTALSEKIKNAINDKFLDRETGIYARGTQTELSVPLYWGVVPEDMKEKVAANLNEKVKQADFHLDVGVLGAKALLDALNRNGYSETAYKVAVQDTYPSWGWWAVNGATTLLENWDLDAERDISDNHMMFGEIGGWFFKSIGGILPDEKKPGFKNIVLKPVFPDGLHESDVTHTSPYGDIISRWTKNKETVNYEVEIPPNATAVFYPPANVKEKESVHLKAGKHQFKLTVSTEVL